MNAFTNPTSGKIIQQRKILEELERQKKLLKQGQPNISQLTPPPEVSSSPPTTGTSNPTTPLTRPVNNTATELHLLSANQRAALDLANKTSFGYFIAQDSSFGNLILPVIPRIGP